MSWSRNWPHVRKSIDSLFSMATGAALSVNRRLTSRADGRACRSATDLVRGDEYPSSYTGGRIRRKGCKEAPCFGLATLLHEPSRERNFEATEQWEFTFSSRQWTHSCKSGLASTDWSSFIGTLSWAIIKRTQDSATTAESLIFRNSELSVVTLWWYE